MRVSFSFSLSLLYLLIYLLLRGRADGVGRGGAIGDPAVPCHGIRVWWFLAAVEARAERVGAIVRWRRWVSFTYRVRA